jgi:hypothetical protein
MTDFTLLVDDLIGKARWLGIYSTPRPSCEDDSLSLQDRISQYRKDLDEARDRVLAAYGKASDAS